MFSLIITLISIALVAALALATLYYGGSAFNKGASKASAAKVLLQAEQILGAARIFYANENRWPSDVLELVSKKYLQSVPVALGGTGFIGAAQALSSPWTTALPGAPVYELSIDKDQCSSVNSSAFLQSGVYNKVTTLHPVQCYSPAAGVFTVVAAASPDELEFALPSENIITTNYPVNAGDAGWVVAPVGGPASQAPVVAVATVTPLQWDEGLVAQLAGTYSQNFTMTNISQTAIFVSWSWESAGQISMVKDSPGLYMAPGESATVTGTLTLTEGDVLPTTGGHLYWHFYPAVANPTMLQAISTPVLITAQP